jgi:hypothetical protein
MRQPTPKSTVERRAAFRRRWKGSLGAQTAILEKLEQGVAFDPVRQKLLLVGKNILPDSRERVLKVKGVYATVSKGFLVSPRVEAPGGLFAEVTYVQGTDEIVGMERVK